MIAEAIYNTNSPAAISAAGLVKRYGTLAAVDGLDLEIPAGQFFGLLGPNGSGKTTTIHMLATLVRPTTGSVHIGNIDVSRHPVLARRQIGLVFQESALDRTLTVRENLRFAGRLYNLSPAISEQRSAELLELFDMADRRNRSVATLSGGMRRALDIVRGVLHEPRVLFLDEPTIGLDLPNRRRIWRFIERLRARTGMTVLLTTHYLEEAYPCDRVCFIRKGRLVDAGEPSALVAKLGRHILEVEAGDLDALRSRLEPELGDCLIDGDTAFFRHGEEDVSVLVRLQTETTSQASAWRVRRPNLNDVFMWISAGKDL
ncbi:MAG: ATP-binding cassette domain-containing protein [Burkholderiales bacterium]|nr:ATP-binding cassette domain-containing protein [Burkholderiales bacterium]